MLYYLRARYYDPAIGRFLSQDPANAGHPYAYAENNPVNFIDPYGLHLCDYAPGFEEECREAADQVEAGANAVGDAICGEGGAVRCAKEAYRYAREEFENSALGDIARSIKPWMTVDYLAFVAGLATLGLGPGGSLATMTLVYGASLAIPAMRNDQLGFGVEATVSGGHWGTVWLEKSLRAEGVLWESQKSRGGAYKAGANFGLSATLRPLQNAFGIAGLAWSGWSCVRSGL